MFPIRDQIAQIQDKLKKKYFTLAIQHLTEIIQNQQNKQLNLIPVTSHLWKGKTRTDFHFE